MIENIKGLLPVIIEPICATCKSVIRYTCGGCGATNCTPTDKSQSVEELARKMFADQADKLAAPWEQQWEPTKQRWRENARAALATLPSQSAGVEERAVGFQAAVALEVGADEDDQYDILLRVRAWVASAKGQSEALRTPASEGDGGRVAACAMSTDAAEHVAFIEACADMLHKFNRTFTASTLRGTAKWVEANTTPPTQQEARAVDGWRAAHMGDVLEAMDALRNGEPWAKVWNELDSKAFRNPMPALLAKSDELDALVAEIEAAPVVTAGSWIRNYMATANRIEYGQRVRLLVSDDRPSHTERSDAA